MEEVEVELKPQRTRARSRQGTAFQTEGKPPNLEELGEERREMRHLSD